MNKGKSREIFKSMFIPPLAGEARRGRDKKIRNKDNSTPPLTPPVRGRMQMNGFALIEVIVSIVILAIVLSAAVGLLYTVGTAVEKNRDRLTATYLAQECLELVRNSRDTAWRNHQKWDCAWANNSCVSSNILSSVKQDPVKVNDVKTKFSREFTVSSSEVKAIQAVNSIISTSSRTSSLRAIKNPAKKDEAMITCTVSWGESDKLSISEILTNWRKR